MENKGCIRDLSDLVYNEYTRRVNEIMIEFGKYEFVFLSSQDWTTIKFKMVAIANLNAE